MFKRMMLSLKGQLEFFCYHKRHEVVLQLLWRVYREKNMKLTAEECRDNLIKIITRLPETIP